MDDLRQRTDRVLAELKKVVVGQEEVLEHLLVALLCEGHVLLEGVPGTGKTLMVKLLARCLDLRFNRVQFTPDLMPSDVIGTNVFDLQRNEFRLGQPLLEDPHLEFGPLLEQSDALGRNGVANQDFHRQGGRI